MAEIIVALNIALTFGVVLFFLFRSKKRTKDRLDHETPKSALAKDGPTGDVEDRARV
ncbi:hypothetical protein JQC91_13045 [Jannaschia sp. Os4]|uniref:hypothetical protein n=1 Tax=Jannaschia sp. Os4 TaxID=2807617 RepID=UPI00193A5861|nr:hypothetical protein [Jannaschia sp. Os4]MBM2577228.1 hypothetical protein [Jannaschia sp. Os4]